MVNLCSFTRDSSSVDDLGAVRGVANVEGQRPVVVLDDGLGGHRQRVLLEQGDGAAAEAAARHPGPGIEVVSTVKQLVIAFIAAI